MNAAKLGLIVFLLAGAAEANTLSVCNSGCTYNNLQAAVNAAQPGDTIVLTAGQTIPCDATLPYTSGDSFITVTSSLVAELPPVGYRVGPQNSPAMPQCQFSSQGIVAQAEAHGQNYSAFTVNLSNSFLTLSGGIGGNGAALMNGLQIEFEINNENNGDVAPPSTVAVPSPLTILTHYYVVNCSTAPACGSDGSSFQVSATPGGTPITITACDSNCQAYGEIGLGMSVDLATSTFTTPEHIASWTNGTPIAFATGGLQLGGAAPAPLIEDEIVYVVNLTGNSFQVAETPGGSPIAITSAGTGMITAANTNVPHHWRFSGIEMAPASGQFIYNMLTLGGGKEASAYGMVSNMEVDRCYIHDFSNAQAGPRRGIADNGEYIYIHDSYIAGMKDPNSDSQAIGGWSSLGPSTITNNFLEAAGENILYGGAWPVYYPTPDQNKTIVGNYLYKPFVWKWAQGNGGPSGSCLWDSTPIDPNHAGGEFWLDTSAGQGYLCVGGTWATTATRPTSYVVKNLYEHKNGRAVILNGNILQGSWVAQQDGQAFTFGQSEGSGPGFANDSVLVTNNIVTNTYFYSTGGTHCTGGPGVGVLPCLFVPHSHTEQNNVATLGGLEYCGVASVTGSCQLALLTSIWNPILSTPGEIWEFNTIVSPDGLGGAPHYATGTYYDDEGNPGRVSFDLGLFENDIRSYDIGGNKGCGDAEFSSLFTNATVLNEALIQGSCAYGISPGASNRVGSISKPGSTSAVSFVNATGSALTGDYHLSSTSPYSAQNSNPTLLSSIGTDLGADVDVVNLATSGAAGGTPPWNVKMGLHITSGSTQAVFSYTAPSFNACTASLYNSPARVLSHQVASVTDNSAASVSDAQVRQAYVPGLQPLTTYWYRLDCGGGVVIVGQLSTALLGQQRIQVSFDWSSPTSMRYSVSRDMSNAVSLPAATRQLVPVDPNSVVYAQAGTTGAVTILVAP